MTTRKIVVFVLEDCVQGIRLANSTRPAHLLSPQATAGFFPDNGDAVAELITRGHTVVVASRFSPATLSTAAYLYDLEYHMLKSFNQDAALTPRQLATWLHGLDWDFQPDLYAGDYAIVTASSNALCTHTPEKFFRNGLTMPEFGVVTTGTRVNTGKDAPSAPEEGDELYPIHAELTRRGGWRIAKLGALAAGVCSKDVSSTIKAKAAYWTLTAAPGVPERALLQHSLLAVLSNPQAPSLKTEDFYFFDPKTHCFYFHPHLLTRREYRSDPELRYLYLKALASLFPTHEARGAQLRLSNVRTIVEYQSRNTNGVASVMGIAKDWEKARTWGANGNSGQNPALSYLPFAGELLAAHTPPEENLSLVAVPATPYSREQPGEVSLRLSRLVGSVLNLPVLPVLRKSGGSFSCQKGGASAVWLLDDQVTSGRSLSEARGALVSCGYTVRGATAFSAGGKGAGSVSVVGPASLYSSIRLKGFTVPLR